LKGQQISRKEFVTRALTGIAGIGILSRETCSGGKYSHSPEIEPSYEEAVLWVHRHKFFSPASVAMVNFELIDKHISWIVDEKI
jgi:hypothetical protein